MHPDVYSMLFKPWCVYEGIYTGDSELVECASLVNHVCILMSMVSLSIMCVCECDVYTLDCELEQCASLVNHICLMMSVVV